MLIFQYGLHRQDKKLQWNVPLLWLSESLFPSRGSGLQYIYIEFLWWELLTMYTNWTIDPYSLYLLMKKMMDINILIVHCTQATGLPFIILSWGKILFTIKSAVNTALIVLYRHVYISSKFISNCCCYLSTHE